jgi:trypsin
MDSQAHPHFATQCWLLLRTRFKQQTHFVSAAPTPLSTFMRFTRRLGAALVATAALAAGETLPANTTRSNATTTSNSSEPTTTMADRVVMLTADRSNATVWCMGLLIAPRAVLTYAHCVGDPKRPLAWAFFGRSSTQFFQSPEEPPTNGDVGDLDAWVSITKTMVHPEFVADGSTPSMDLAVLQLQEPRTMTDAFPLVANMSALDAANGLDLELFQMTDNFVTTSRDTKLVERGTFRKVPWSFCVASRVPMFTSSWKVVATQPKGQVCVVASVVEDRRYEQLTNAFVLLDNKLVGLSVVAANGAAGAAHRVMFLSDQASFITEATHKTEVWTAVSQLVVGGKDTPTVRGYLSGLRQSKSGENFCLGSLIAPKFVLTAAHCVAGASFSHVSVGSMYVATEIDGEQIKVKRAIVHPNYDAATFRYDYAIVELEYISIQSPILLYNGSGEEAAAGKRLTFFGYGASSADKNAGKIQYVDLPVVDKKQCKAVLQLSVLDDTMMCAGGEEGKDACSGDSGGPLVYHSKSPASLVAMASSGRGCGIKGLPAVYAVVATASNFIDKYVDGHRWITAYGSGVSPTTTTAPSASGAAAPAPATNQPPSTPAVTQPQEPRSRGTPSPMPIQSTAASPSAAVLDDIETAEGWKPVSSILMKDTNPSSLVIDSSYTQLTRDVVSSSILSARSSLAATSHLDELTKYSGATSVAFHTSDDTGLDRIRSLISSFDARLLRRRAVRFTRGDNTTCLAHR